jgi:hypothetical protein
MALPLVQSVATLAKEWRNKMQCWFPGRAADYFEVILRDAPEEDTVRVLCVNAEARRSAEEKTRQEERQSILSTISEMRQ